VAAISKIAENAHRYLQIAFAEDQYSYCQANNINFAELRDSLNTMARKYSRTKRRSRRILLI
jgi:UDP-N-acetyl-D-mannosaminuronic acid dehydrogenase